MICFLLQLQAARRWFIVDARPVKNATPPVRQANDGSMPMKEGESPASLRGGPEWKARKEGCLAEVVLFVAVVGGTTSAVAGRTTSEAPPFGVGDSGGDQLTGHPVRHLRHVLSSGGFSAWCER